ncbi:MAG: hypothetical protein Q4B85_04735 [Lachnospiraceae bacterium]|nr:hypothetical protein [Lachnospiraceae bacterium]
MMAVQKHEDVQKRKNRLSGWRIHATHWRENKTQEENYGIQKLC